MPLIYQPFIRRADLRQARDRLFVFGDNCEHQGLGGQAREMRGEPNAIGLPTKWNPRQFLRDEDIKVVHFVSRHERAALIKHHSEGGVIVWPRDGIGTGLAQLSKHAPWIAWYWSEFLRQFDPVSHLLISEDPTHANNPGQAQSPR